jgi:YYY domain-containing protein
MDVTLALAWYGVVLLLSGLAAPVVGWLFPDWPDRGLSLAPAVAFGTLTVTAYWVGQVSFGPHAAGAGLFVLAALAALSVRRGVSPSPRVAVVPLVVGTAAFALLVVLRALDPAIGPFAGEQFLDFGLVHAVRRTATLPPEDIWFAGERMRYYFGGPLLTALLTWLTDTPPASAYNLMAPTVFATLATAAYGVTGAIAAGRGLPARPAGILGAFLVALGGPLLTAARGAASYLPRDLVAEYGSVLFVAIRSGLTYQEKVDAARFLDGGEFNYWFGRYGVPDAPNVFPFWTYVNGDLRPHMYAGPFLLLAVGLAVAYYRTPAERTRRRQVLCFGALPVVGGLLAVTNTFDLPAVVGLVWLTVLFADADPASVLPAPVVTRLRHSTRQVTEERATTPGRRLLAEGTRAVVAAGVAAVVAAVAALWAAPFLLGHTADNEGIVLFGPTSTLGGLLLVWGGFLAAFSLAFLPPAVDGWNRRRRLGVAVALLAGVGVTALAGHPALGLFVPVVLGGWWLHRTGRIQGFDVVLAVAGGGLVLFPEVAYIAVWPYDPNAPRWNTVYKVAMQVWVFWGVAAAVALTRVFSRARDALVPVSDAASRFSPGGEAGPFPRRRVAGAVVAAIVLVSAAVFPAFAVWTETDPMLSGDDPDLSLDGEGYLRESRPAELAAIEWLRTETSGQPAMVSRPTDDAVYTWAEGANLAATFSGVPTLAGWRHAAGYHGLDAYRIRANHTRAIYERDWAVARDSLRYFDVEYVYVGPSEREAYGTRDFAAESPAVTVAYENSAVTLYHVNRTRLRAGS